MAEIKGVNIDTTHPDVKKVKKIDDVKKLGFFSHLLPDEEKEACKTLLEAVVGGTEKTETAGAGEGQPGQ